jgi:trehalose/maltose hydrolase-like predicted phosphorylase
MDDRRRVRRLALRRASMPSHPISPPAVTDNSRDELPAYLSNGVIGLRVLDIPLRPGVTIVSGLSGRHPTAGIEAAARAPYPLAGDIAIDGLWLSESLTRTTFRRQAYDFSCGELLSEFEFQGERARASVSVLTLCSRTEPTIALQEVTVRTNSPAEVTIRAGVDPSGVTGEWVRRELATPSEPKPTVDGALRWRTLEGISDLGAAYVTESPTPGAEVTRGEWREDTPLASEYRFTSRAGEPLVIRQMTAMVPSQMHPDPHRQAVRLVARARDIGWDQLRADNRAAWAEIWRGRIVLVGAERRWQEIADAAVFYLNTSVHPASPSSTSIFGLAQWTDYHYYYGHVMWDIETFGIPPLTVFQPHAARAVLDFRSRSLDAARRNADLHARRGTQFPWEASMSAGDEAAPGDGKASWYEDHVSLDVALAFVWHAHLTDDEEFIRTQAWPVVRGVCEWLSSRLVETDRGFEMHRAMGIAERTQPSDNEAFTMMSARMLLEEAVGLARRIDAATPRRWLEMASRLRIPTDSGGRHIVSYDGWQSNHEKGATPGPLAGLFPVWYPAGSLEGPTLRRYLDLAPGYIGSPMLSSLYGVWAAWCGDRQGAARLFDEGYGRFISGRFSQTLEYRPDTEPSQPKAGPFFANLAGFLHGLLFGLPRLRPSASEPADWALRRVTLPAGWEAIEVDRLWIRDRPTSLTARHGRGARLEALG